MNVKAIGAVSLTVVLLGLVLQAPLFSPSGSAQATPDDRHQVLSPTDSVQSLDARAVPAGRMDLPFETEIHPPFQYSGKLKAAKRRAEQTKDLQDDDQLDQEPCEQESESEAFELPLLEDPLGCESQVVESTATLLNGRGIAAREASPPDATGAVGPNHYLELTNNSGSSSNNGSAALYERANLRLLSEVSLSDLTGADDSDWMFDPQIQWDPQSDRWFYLAVRQISSLNNYLAYGWSKRGDPGDLELSADDWCSFFIPTERYLEDFPKLGHNDNHLIFGGNPTYLGFGRGGRIWAVPKPARGDRSCDPPRAYSFGSPQQPLRTADGHLVSAPAPANTLTGSEKGYVVSADTPPNPWSPEHIMAWYLSGPRDAPRLTAIGNINVPGYRAPPDVRQPGSESIALDAGGGWLTQAVALPDPNASGTLAVWTQHTVRSADGRSEVRWYELLPEAATPVRQRGTIGDPRHFVFNAAISPAMNGNSAVINYNVASEGLRTRIRARSRTGSTPLGAMNGEVTLGRSIGVQQRSRRWGDYAGASPDPLASDVVWGSNQLSGPTVPSGANWRTRNFAVRARVPAPPSLALVPSALNFLRRPVGSLASAEVQLHNTGTSQVSVTGVRVEPASVGDFWVPYQTCTSGPLLPGRFCYIIVNFAPVAIGSRQASLVITRTGGQSSVPLSGEGRGLEYAICPPDCSPDPGRRRQWVWDDWWIWPAPWWY